MRIGRRSLFFAFLALICLALIPPTPPELRWVCMSIAALALLWSILLAVEELLGKRETGEQSGSTTNQH